LLKIRTFWYIPQIWIWIDVSERCSCSSSNAYNPQYTTNVFCKKLENVFSVCVYVWENRCTERSNN